MPRGRRTSRSCSQTGSDHSPGTPGPFPPCSQPTTRIGRWKGRRRGVLDQDRHRGGDPEDGRDGRLREPEVRDAVGIREVIATKITELLRDDAARAAVRAGAQVKLGCDHTNYPAMTVIAPETLANLAGDLSA